jgi:hypothetical protein
MKRKTAEPKEPKAKKAKAEKAKVDLTGILRQETIPKELADAVLTSIY